MSNNAEMDAISLSDMGMEQPTSADGIAVNHLSEQQSKSRCNKRPWKRALLWLLFLGPFFFISYGFANWLASQQTDVLHIVFEWEKHIPFIPWTIIPYWVIDALYVVSLFVCISKAELDIHAKRLLTAQIIAVICFIVTPMGFSFERPETSGLFGAMFVALASFDQPFNQAPSLHIALLVILWVLFVRHLPRKFVWLFHSLGVLIAISVLTTYQHHFIDIPTGALLGLFSVWLWPDNGRKMLNFKHQKFSKSRVRIALYYFMAASVLAILGVAIGDIGLWILWPAVSLLFVAIIYGLTGVEGFQKNAQGEISISAKALLFPYLIAAKINSRIWTRKDNGADHIVDDVWLGRYPLCSDIYKNKYYSVIDMTAEFSASVCKTNWQSVPCLDLVSVEMNSILKAIDLIEEQAGKGTVLVSCALGYSRSAITVIAWLLVSGREVEVDIAINLVQNKRPSIVLSNTDRKVLEELIGMGGSYEK